MTPVHVGYVLKVYPRLSETFIVNEILELERQGARVTVFSLRVPQEGRFHEKLARVAADVVYLPALTTHDVAALATDRAAELAPARERLGGALWDILASGDVRRIKHFSQAVALHLEATRRGVQHLHAHFATSSTAVAALASEFSGIPFSFTAHAKDIYLDAHDLSLLEDRLRRARFCVTVCDANLRHLRETFGDAGRVERIYNGLDLDDLPGPASGNESAGPAASRGNGADADVPTILGVGRLVPKKGFDTLLEACAMLAHEGTAFRCVIVGDGAERAALEHHVRSLGLTEHVALTGALPNGRVHRMIAQADVMALPCRVAADGNRDALPTVLLESLALGTPAISTPVTGIPEILGNEAGALVPPDDPAALAAELRRFLNDSGLRRVCGTAGRARVERLFDVRRNVAQLHELFRVSATGTTAMTTEEALHAASLR
ncbi:MAG TPA: glycosyltransferase [bacterium]|nr:glycosyltransferase [bacterium]